ncbi:MAG: polysaccharide deacetylase family protein [Bacteroidales bacterium]
MRRRKALKVMGAGAMGILSGSFVIPRDDHRHIITLSFDDGFKKSSIKTAEIYEKHGLSSCLNIIASAHLDQFQLPNEYHAWPVGDFALWNDLKKRGHEIMPHSYKHTNLTEIPLEEAQSWTQKCIDVFNEELEGFVASESVFSLPHNASTPELEEWLLTRFRAIRTHGGLYNPLPFKGMGRLGCGGYGPDNIDRHLVETVEEFLSGPPGWYIYNTHGLDDEGWGPLSSSLLDELLDQWKGMDGVEVLPVVPALDSAQS